MDTPTHDHTWWLERLLPRLVQQQRDAARPWRYYEGDHDMPWVHNPRVRHEFAALMTQNRANYVRLPVDAVDERLDIEGFRSSTEGAGAAAWDMFKRNGLHSSYSAGHVAAMVAKQAYIVTWPSDIVGARQTVEDSRSMVVQTHPLDPSRVVAALKAVTDDLSGLLVATVITADGVAVFTAPLEDNANLTDAEWTLDTDSVEALPAALGGQVPVAVLVNRPDIYGIGESEIADAIPVQDRINKTLWDRGIGSEFTAFPQRYGIGVELEFDEETGQPIDPGLAHKAAVDRLMVFQDPDVKVGQFPQIDLTPYLAAVEQDVISIARITRTPPSYMDTKGQFPSGDALRAAEAGLIAKVRRRQQAFGGAWRRAAQHALAIVSGSAEALTLDLEVMWRNPETRTLGESSDWALKLHTLGVPTRFLLPTLGFTQDEVDRIEQARQSDAILGAMAQLNAQTDTTGDVTALEAPDPLGLPGPDAAA